MTVIRRVGFRGIIKQSDYIISSGLNPLKHGTKAFRDKVLEAIKNTKINVATNTKRQFGASQVKSAAKSSSANSLKDCPEDYTSPLEKPNEECNRALMECLVKAEASLNGLKLNEAIDAMRQLNKTMMQADIQERAIFKETFSTTSWLAQIIMERPNILVMLRNPIKESNSALYHCALAVACSSAFKELSGRAISSNEHIYSTDLSNAEVLSLLKQNSDYHTQAAIEKCKGLVGDNSTISKNLQTLAKLSPLKSFFPSAPSN